MDHILRGIEFQKGYILTKLITNVGLDADDTLWQNEEFFHETQSKLCEILQPWAPQDQVRKILSQTEDRNIPVYGYGIKGFVLSMIETALSVSDHTIPQPVITRIITMGKDMLLHPVNLLPHVQSTLKDLSQNYRLVLVTKGDLRHQEHKIATSGLAAYFDDIKIVSDKTPETYGQIFQPDESQSVMIGNSMKSDVIPALAAGMRAIHIPSQHEWDHEKAKDPIGNVNFFRIESITSLPQLLSEMQQ